MNEIEPHWSLIYFQGWFLAVPISAGVGFGYFFLAPYVPRPEGHGFMSQLPHFCVMFALMLVPIVMIGKYLRLRRIVVFSVAALILALPFSFILAGRYFGAN